MRLNNRTTGGEDYLYKWTGFNTKNKLDTGTETISTTSEYDLLLYLVQLFA